MKRLIKIYIEIISVTILANCYLLDAGEPMVSGSLQVEDLNLLGLNGGDNFGASISGGGDFNGDGHADWVIGAPYADIGFINNGAAYLFLGGSYEKNAPVSIFVGEANEDQAGMSVASGFDLNGDGFDDIAVGVRFNDRGAGDGGAVFVYFGRADPLPEPTPDVYLVAEAGDDWFGQSVSTAGDVNNDGFGDLIVGAPYNDSAANAAGRAYVVLGSSNIEEITTIAIEGAALSNSHFGWSVSGGGDINNDGFDDVIVGARLHGTGPNGAAGRAYLFLGGDPFEVTPDVVYEGESKNDWFGEAVSVLEDVNGDGFDDLLVGAIYRDPGGISAAGEASLFLGGLNPDSVRDLRIAGPEADAQAGNAVASAGDINGDGFGDFLVGAHLADTTGGLNAGKAMLLFGASLPDATIDLTIIGTDADDQLGTSLAKMGEPVLGDGQAFGVGIHYDDTIGEEEGAGRATLFRELMPELNLQIKVSDSGILLETDTHEGYFYQFQKKDSLQDGNWSDLGSSFSGDGTNASFSDSSFGDQEFYRLKRSKE